MATVVWPRRSVRARSTERFDRRQESQAYGLPQRRQARGPDRESLRPTSRRADDADKSLLIVDDDKPFGDAAGAGDGGRAASRRESPAASPKASPRSQVGAPAFAVIDLKLGDGSGLDVMRALKAKRPEARAIILTGYGAIATAGDRRQARRLRLSRQTCQRRRNRRALMPSDRTGRRQGAEHPMSADRVRWEHIQRIYESCERNVSETARQLNMHRRTLQRILGQTRAALIEAAPDLSTALNKCAF